MEDAAVAAAYRFAGPAATGGLIGALRAGTLDLLRREYELPARLTDAVIASGDQELKVALAANLSGTPRMVAVHLRLARLGDPVVGKTLYKAGRPADGSAEIRAAVLAAADPADPRWEAPGGLVDDVIGRTSRQVVQPGLRAPFPAMVARALHRLGPKLPPSMVLGACRAILEHGGRGELEALAELLPEWDELGHPGLAALVGDAADAPDPAAVLAGEVTATDEAVHRARTYGGWGFACDGPVDWDQVAAEHHRLPLSADAVMALNRLPGCPRDLVMAGYRADPAGTLIRSRGPLPPELILDPAAGLADWHLRGVLTRGLVGGRLTADWVAAEVRPAEVALISLIEAGQSDGRLRADLARLVAPLRDPAGWLFLYRTVSRFGGTLGELIASAAAEGGSAAGLTWPRAIGAAFPSREPDGARRLFHALLERAEPEVQEAVVPYLDGRAVQHLLVFGNPSRRVRDHVAAVHGRSARIAHASRWDLPPEIVSELLDLDDPEVNAKLYIYGAIAWDERVRILAGRGRDGGAVPVHPGLLDDLLEVKAAHRRDWLTAGHLSGDPAVLRVTLSRCRLYTEGGRLRVLIRLWGRHGPREVRSFLDETEFPGRTKSTHPFPAGTRKAVRQALDAADGLAALRARLAAEEDPARLVALLRRTAAGAVADLVRHLAAEGAAVPWPELSRAHTAEPLGADLLAALSAAPDCPPALLVEALRAGPLQPRAEGMDWLTQALDDGRLTTGDVFHHAWPAPAVLAFLTATDINRRPARPRWQPPFREVLALTRDALGPGPEAWAALVRLLPGSTGSLPELIRAAAG